MKKQTIIITGATGFIGQRVSILLNKHFKNSDIYFYGKNKIDKREEEGVLFLKNNNIKVKKIDLVKPGTLHKLPKNADLIIHLAANTNTDDIDHRVNDKGVVNLIKYLKPKSSQHIIHVSTTAFMGGKRNFRTKLTEKSKCYPTNLYGRTKYLGEKYIFEYCLKNNVPLTIFRLPTVYGKNMRKGSFFDTLVPMVKNKNIVSRLNWQGKTDFIHVDDVAETIIFFAKNKSVLKKGGLYILSGESITMSKIFKIIYKKLNLDYKQIRLSKYIWVLVKIVIPLVPFSEKFLNPKLYNWLWRSTLIVDNVIWCDNSKIKNVMKHKWKPKKIEGHVADIIN